MSSAAFACGRVPAGVLPCGITVTRESLEAALCRSKRRPELCDLPSSVF